MESPGHKIKQLLDSLQVFLPPLQDIPSITMDPKWIQSMETHNFPILSASLDTFIDGIYL